jgi:hypothetical protein
MSACGLEDLNEWGQMMRACYAPIASNRMPSVPALPALPAYYSRSLSPTPTHSHLPLPRAHYDRRSATTRPARPRTASC